MGEENQSLSISPEGAASNIFSGQYDDSMTGQDLNLPYLINTVYYPFIIEYVKIVEILSKVSCLRMHAGKILSVHKNEGRKDAAVKFMSLLRESSEKGSYQEFLQALKDTEYTIVVNAIEKGSIAHDQDEHMRILDIFWSRLSETIDAREMACLLLEKEVISSYEEQCIRKSADKDKNIALFELIDAMPRKNPKWFEHFWEALYSIGQYELCELLNDKWFSKKRSAEDSIFKEENVSPDIEIENPLVGDRTSKTIGDGGISTLSHMQSEKMTSPGLHLDIPCARPFTLTEEPSKCECRLELQGMKDEMKLLRDQVEINSKKLDQVLTLLQSLAPKSK